eukprot:scaffold1446_cov391-Prasinococcus_capsulatus_cf.AAC.16
MQAVSARRGAERRGGSTRRTNVTSVTAPFATKRFTAAYAAWCAASELSGSQKRSTSAFQGECAAAVMIIEGALRRPGAPRPAGTAASPTCASTCSVGAPRASSIWTSSSHAATRACIGLGGRRPTARRRSALAAACRWPDAARAPSSRARVRLSGAAGTCGGVCRSFAARVGHGGGGVIRGPGAHHRHHHLWRGKRGNRPAGLCWYMAKGPSPARRQSGPPAADSAAMVAELRGRWLGGEQARGMREVYVVTPSDFVLLVLLLLASAVLLRKAVRLLLWACRRQGAASSTSGQFADASQAKED